jgi:hypothetical protein
MKTLAIVLLAFLPTMVQAGDALAGTLNTIHFLTNGIVLFYTDGVRSGVPTCAAGQPHRFAVNAATAGGKVQLAGLLSAHAAGKQIRIVGSGDCTIYPDSEAVNYFYTIDD